MKGSKALEIRPRTGQFEHRGAAETITHGHRVAAIRPQLKRLLERGNLLFLLDGLDEIPDSDERQEAVEWIEKALTAHSDCHFVVTCRYAGYRALADQFTAEFLELHLRPLDADQAARFVHNWFRIVETGLGHPEAVAIDAANELIERLNRELAGHVRETWDVESYFELELEKLYRRLVLPPMRHGRGGARKRYAGLLDGGQALLDLTFGGLEPAATHADVGDLQAEKDLGQPGTGRQVGLEALAHPRLAGGGFGVAVGPAR